MGIPDSPTAQGPCPTEEELAAFLDGMLPPAERARITAHLADCESCYEIFAGAVHFQQDESAVDREGDKEGRVVPFPSKKKEEVDARGGKLWWIAAAATVLLVGGGLAGYRLFLSETKIELADLKSKPISAQDLYHYAAYRGGNNHVDSSDDAPRFMVGVLLTDISLAPGQGNIDADRLAEVGRKLQKVMVSPEGAQAFLASAEKKLRSGDPTASKEVAKSLPAQEAALEEYLSLSYKFGKWSEAGRLAAKTRTARFFSRWDNKRFLADLLKDPLAGEEGVTEYLLEIKAITDRGNFQTKDYEELSDRFTKIIRHYDI